MADDRTGYYLIGYIQSGDDVVVECHGPASLSRCEKAAEANSNRPGVCLMEITKQGQYNRRIPNFRIFDEV